jgi:hypothetical protein
MGANLMKAKLEEAKFDLEQILSSRNWKSARFDPEIRKELDEMSWKQKS